jgi:hypothetical protein
MRLGRLLCRFLASREGSVTPLLALAALPLFGFVGAAIDYSRAASARTAMQAALDASALMVSKDAQTLAPAALVNEATSSFKAIFNRPEVYGVGVTPQFSQPAEGSFLLKMTGSGKIDTLFARLLGQTTISFTASTDVVWGIKKLNLALVLDNTGSMAQSG